MVNLLNNPSFELGTSTTIDDWFISTYSGNTPTVDNTIAHTGVRSVKVSLPDGINARSGNIYTPQHVLKPSTTYKLSGWVKTENIGGTTPPPTIRVFEYNSLGIKIQQTNLFYWLTGTNDWTYKEIIFTTTSTTTQAYVTMGTYLGWGNSWYDDLSLEEYIQPQVGSLSLSSTPSGAAVYIDDVRQTPLTPNIFTNILVGTHTVKLTYYGYIDTIDNNIIITANQTTTKIYTMTQVPPSGTLVVSSTPYGATVFLDNVKQQQLTPLTITNIQAGTHTINISLNGYNTVTDNNVIVIANVITTKSYTLNITTNILINSSFELGTSTTIDNWTITTEYTNGNTPSIDNTISHNSARSVKINLPVGINAKSGTVSTPRFVLNPNTTYKLSGWVKTENVGGTTPSPTIRVFESNSSNTTTQQTNLFYWLSGTNDWTYKEIIFTTVSATTQAYVSFGVWLGWGNSWYDDLSLDEYSPPQVSSLSLSSVPSGAVIYIDDVRQTPVTPAIISNILTGTHTVKLTLNGYVDTVDNNVIITENQMTTKIYTMLQCKIPTCEYHVTVM